MPSRLETLLSDLMDAQIEDRDSLCIKTDALEDLFALVEAARKRARVGGHRAGYGCYESSFAKGVKGCQCDLDDIVESLAKLDKVQP
jgi:hypothetical protein